ncbi:hypothetical protein SCOCK_190133 [Actinacidiphila cocklensis]|uniref:Uncharacterized protein n=1 Tax=Actinacidiphila cocklensis TaxID=887465 RepID=A0A9W4DN16_9ACTN|nr:hypothetical protein SCOCK_190133 [Actinacidiphila cocklensis]
MPQRHAVAAEKRSYFPGNRLICSYVNFGREDDILMADKIRPSACPSFSCPP